VTGTEQYNPVAVETWLPVPHWEELYEVSDHGRVRSLPRIVAYIDGRVRAFPGRILSPGVRDKGHLFVNLHRDNRPTISPVHRLVLAAFVGPPFEGAEGLHWDDNPANNRLSNLRWGTRSDNRFDSVRNGGYSNGNDRKTQCKHGHPFDDRNTYLIPSTNHRACRTCRKDEKTRRRQRKAGALV